jgi:hypothetical protein
LDYPIVEAIKSILPICDDFVVAVGNSDDDTLFSMIVNNIGNTVTKDLMYNTVMEDKKIIEEIKLKYAYGKFKRKTILQK